MTKIIGVMSGSSLDGLDIAMVNFDNHGWTIEKKATISLPDHLPSALSNIVNQTAFELAKTESAFTSFVIEALKAFIDNQEDITAIGIHGHTVLHLPEEKVSWQLLNGGRVAGALGLKVVCDFRNQDMALGGQGTPMAVIADRDLFPGYDYYINLGGIANISHQVNDSWIAYDVCPCNQVLNYFSKQAGLAFDKDGLLARTGHIDQQTLNNLNSENFFAEKPPKSLDNTWIKAHFIKKAAAGELSIPDSLKTVTECIVQQLAINIKTHNSSVYLTGGGAKNIFLVEALRARLSTQSCTLVIPEETIIDYKEAILIAYCSHLRIQEQSNFIPSATGASHASIGGALYLPSKLQS